ncbi:MAG: FAD-dependent oxidoreductase [Eubacteriaceae bacterium]|jgi:pyruvate/2-oxoglutarate dehydrogenase complex dihydrolipoamide dehydrogenase (E3) component|nr:FAD-dependent oxidoreductase [Eubacteriaceae bacterium]
MKKYDTVIIGFGKGGKTLAGSLASGGEKVALIERSKERYGGTCINVACIPSKSLENSARHSAMIGGDFAEKSTRYTKAIEDKRALTAKLRKANYDKAAAAGVDIIDGTAEFTGPHSVKVTGSDGTSELEGDKIIINTGSSSFVPPVEGLADSRYSFISETMMELEKLPQRLLIIGGGYIGLEFSSYYNNFGSEVTIIQDGDAFIPREDKEISDAVYDDLLSRGIKIMKNTKIKKVEDFDGCAVVYADTPDGPAELEAEAILVATGRRPELTGLHPEKAGIELTERGAVKTDASLRTSVPHIYAMGDVAGGLQFTYISLDDSRIVKSTLQGGTRTTENRGAVPYSVFLDPPLSRVGLSEQEALDRGYEIKKAVMPAKAIPKALVMSRPAGLLKVIIDGKTDLILGAHFYCAESQEMINTVKLAMDAGIRYQVLRDNIYTHPTMSEGMNDLFSMVR